MTVSSLLYQLTTLGSLINLLCTPLKIPYFLETFPDSSGGGGGNTGNDSCLVLLIGYRGLNDVLYTGVTDDTPVYNGVLSE